ncbi:peptidoglycan DD-metalloendopeptidase family protein [Paenibacillus ginsengarvi]|uniref:M23 family metallopeptidase n=1 Tax=Paenibacillus ginsengarvi TaxID=400777 RepID=A0A3B0CBQ7_9BACL|nr:peptidoglycan DD-metalloendopeptidase family protein [Paenibacillus ginsengarvi]RKN83845.1 M23 family metallopeptidase [Paenibacillus ginsengarvi]
MEVKSNVRRRRMDRMKQIVTTGQEERFGGGNRADGQGSREMERAPVSYESAEEGTPFRRQASEQRLLAYREEDDPEWAWKRQESQRWRSLGGPGGGGNWERKPPSIRSLWTKLGISAVLFAGIWGMFQVDHPLAERGQRWVTAALTEEYNFSGMAAWYERKFGGLPAILPALGGKRDPEAQKVSSSSLKGMYTPVHGKIVEKLSDGELGITLRTVPEAKVVAIDTGRVVAVSDSADKGTTVVLQHSGGLQSIYGWLQGTSLKTNDWVKGGETIGSVTTDAAGGAGKLYVAVKKEGEYVKPQEVIPFD